MTLFNGPDLNSVLEQSFQKAKQEIESQESGYLLNANETDLARYFTEKYRIDPLTIHDDNVSMATREDMIPAERFAPHMFNVERGRSYKKQVITYHIPFSGDQTLFLYNPQFLLRRSEFAVIVDREIRFDVVNWRDSADEIKREWQEFLGRLKSTTTNLNSQINAFHQRLENELPKIITQRRADLLKKANLAASLGIPLKKSANVPSTFAVPAIKKKIVIAKPVASNTPFTPEPTLDEKTYHEILKAIHDMGIEMERHPSTYKGKKEEPLRDLFLMVLSANFQGVTGETFNKEGKTDILIRHEGKNLFVAECAVWEGAKGFSPKIDQLFSYLTWRDSKTALICFVRNKEFTAVLETIKKEVPSHARFLKTEAPAGEAWLRYQFTLPDDQRRAVHVAVLCFHLP